MTLRHGTLTATEVATVNLGADYGRVAVLHKGGDVAAPIYVHVGGATDGVPDPATSPPAGYTVPAGARRTITFDADGATVVKLVSAGAAPYEIEA